jgi:hypothetical protein
MMRSNDAGSSILDMNHLEDHRHINTKGPQLDLGLDRQQLPTASGGSSRPGKKLKIMLKT